MNESPPPLSTCEITAVLAVGLRLSRKNCFDVASKLAIVVGSSITSVCVPTISFTDPGKGTSGKKYVMLTNGETL